MSMSRRINRHVSVLKSIGVPAVIKLVPCTITALNGAANVDVRGPRGSGLTYINVAPGRALNQFRSK